MQITQCVVTTVVDDTPTKFDDEIDAPRASTSNALIEPKTCMCCERPKCKCVINISIVNSSRTSARCFSVSSVTRIQRCAKNLVDMLMIENNVERRKLITQNAHVLRRVASPLALRLFAIFNLLLCAFSVANGYVVGRLLTLQQDDIYPSTQRYLFTQQQAKAQALDKRYVKLDVKTEDLTFIDALPEIDAIAQLYQVLRDIATAAAAEDAMPRRRAGHRRKTKRHTVTAASPDYFLQLGDDADAWEDEHIQKTTRIAGEEALATAAHLQEKRASLTTKKSALKSLKKFSSNGARNCFFTPIQCMIHHDMSKYKKLIENNSGDFITAKMNRR